MRTLMDFKMDLYIKHMENDGTLYNGNMIDRIIRELKESNIVSTSLEHLGGENVSYCNLNNILYITPEFIEMEDRVKAVSLVVAYVNSYLYKLDTTNEIQNIIKELGLVDIVEFDKLPKNNIYTLGLIAKESLKCNCIIKLQVDDILKINVIIQKLIVSTFISGGFAGGFTLAVGTFYYNKEDKRVLTKEEEKKFIEYTEVLEALNDEINNFK